MSNIDLEGGVVVDIVSFLRTKLFLIQIISRQLYGTEPSCLLNRCKCKVRNLYLAAYITHITFMVLLSPTFISVLVVPSLDISTSGKTIMVERWMS